MTKEWKERIIFDNTDVTEGYEAAKEYLLEETEEESSEEEIWNFYNEETTNDWDAEMQMLAEFIKNSANGFLVVGEVRRWNGQFPGGKICNSLSELSDAWRDCQYVKIYDVNGHFYIKCSHHDGTNFFEMKELTEKGKIYTQTHWDVDTREFHQILWNSTKYTHLPHYAHQVYGCPKREAA